MKPGNTSRMLKNFVVGLGLVVVCNASAQTTPHELICAVSFGGDQILTFWSDNPGTILSSQAVSGLQAGERVLSVDYWDGQLYALGSRSRLYFLDPSTGQVNPVSSSQFSPGLTGSAFGFQNTTVGAQIVSELDTSQNICRTTGGCSTDPVLSYAPGDRFAGTSPNITATAYNRAADTLYALDSLRRTIAQLDPTTGQLVTLTPMGVGFSRYSGFDFSDATGTAYLGTSPGSDAPQANFYTLDLSTGQAALIGLIGGVGDNILVSGLTVVPGVQSLADLQNLSAVPEPSTPGLLLCGGALWLFGTLRRRGRQMQPPARQ